MWATRLPSIRARCPLPHRLGSEICFRSRAAKTQVAHLPLKVHAARNTGRDAGEGAFRRGEKMTYRRIAVVLFGIVLAFLLGGVLDYLVATHTRDGRLAMRVVLLGSGTTMTDAQIAHAIGDDPVRVIRRASQMGDAAELSVGLIVGILVACVEKRVPGRMTAFTLAPYFFWNFWNEAFARALPPAESAFKVAKVSGINAVYLALAILVSVAVARLFSSRARLADIQQKRA